MNSNLVLETIKAKKRGGHCTQKMTDKHMEYLLNLINKSDKCMYLDEMSIELQSHKFEDGEYGPKMLISTISQCSIKESCIL